MYESVGGQGGAGLTLEIQRHSRKPRPPVQLEQEIDHTSTPARLRARAAELRIRAQAQFDALNEEADALETAAKHIQAARTKGGGKRTKRDGLNLGRTERSMSDDMDVDTSQSAALKSGIGRSTRKHPGQKKLYEVGHTVTSLAKELKETRPRVSAWFAEGEANRPIPRKVADLLQQRYGISTDVWARIKD